MFRCVSVALLLVLSVSAHNFPGKEEFEAARDKCIKETGVNPENLNGPGRHRNDDLIVDDKVKCFGACMLKERGTLKEDGSFDAETAIEKLPPHIPDRERAIETLNSCASEKGENDCDTAHKIYLCLREKKAVHFIFPRPPPPPRAE